MRYISLGGKVRCYNYSVKQHLFEILLLKKYLKQPCKTAAAAAKSRQSCPTLCNPVDGSPPGSPVPGILQARILEWVAISFSNPWKWKAKMKLLSRVQPSATPWTAAFQAPLSTGFSRQEYWSGVPLPSPVIMYSTVYTSISIFQFIPLPLCSLVTMFVFYISNSAL